MLHAIADAVATNMFSTTQQEWFGVGKPPADAQWLELTRRDPEAGTVEQMGTNCVEELSWQHI